MSCDENRSVDYETWEKNIPIGEKQGGEEEKELKCTRVLRDITVRLQISYLHSPDDSLFPSALCSTAASKLKLLDKKWRVIT
jgi:hypothetical protein